MVDLKHKYFHLIPYLFCVTIGIAMTRVQPSSAAEVQRQDIKVFAISGSEGMDLSGLSFCQNQLITVADNINEHIYAIELGDDVATLEPFLELPEIPDLSVNYKLSHLFKYYLDYIRAGGDRMDWEGVSCKENTIYLVSERKSAVLLVDDGEARWLDMDLYNIGVNNGFMRNYNGYLEAIFATDDTLYGFYERQERGVFFVDIDRADQAKIMLSPLPNNLDLEFRHQSYDIAGAYIEGDYLYSLERNASSICKRWLGSFKAIECLSYAEIENDTDYVFDGARYGLGEGLAMDKRFIYVVFDNNRRPRIASGDRRALLLQIKRPAGW